MYSKDERLEIKQFQKHTFETTTFFYTSPLGKKFLRNVTLPPKYRSQSRKLRKPRIKICSAKHSSGFVIHSCGFVTNVMQMTKVLRSAHHYAAKPHCFEVLQPLFLWMMASHCCFCAQRWAPYWLECSMENCRLKYHAAWDKVEMESVAIKSSSLSLIVLKIPNNMEYLINL